MRRRELYLSEWTLIRGLAIRTRIGKERGDARSWSWGVQRRVWNYAKLVAKRNRL
ncbi:hypothetical protein EMEDMD4_790064 [Sinorhizobium medicae]|uniref:Uncharacterized protein n=1 Tax=Sinorhizobium medicae TaxID=110321 RepID=A0A508X658_9HYPH|nr:hypothetical protein EMEDMD4_790064 [Sinorhizobium medicae]